MDFSDEQLEFIGAPFDKNTLVIAPPGSGKSMTTRARVAYMIMSGVPAESILVTMFNKPAAKEFRQDYNKLNVEGTPTIRHYHSLGYKLCEGFMKKGILPTWKLEVREFIWQKLAVDALRKAIAEFGSTDIDIYDSSVIDSFTSFLDYCKSDTQPSSVMFERLGLSSHLAPFKLGFDIFEQTRAHNQMRSFNDLLYDVVRLIKQDSRCSNLIANRLDQIIIDEYQDINPIVQDLFTIMAGERAKTTGIGDDDQTIFEWRGSNPLVMSEHWDHKYPDSQKFTLKTTFRYGHSLAMAANNCIFNNSKRAMKMCLSAPSTPKTEINIGYYAPPSFGAEPYTDTKQVALVDSIRMFISEGNAYSDIAILPRLYHVSPFIELALFRAGIPYQLSSGKSISTLPAFLAFEALANFCRGGSGIDAAGLFAKVLMTPNPGVKANMATAFFDVFSNVQTATPDDVKAVIPNSKPFIHKRISKKINAIKESIDKASPAEAFHVYINDYLIEELEKSLSQKQSRSTSHTMALAHGFFELARQAPTFDDLLTSLELLKGENNTSDNAVRIMSQHMAKGITVGMAVIPACCETISPATVSGKTTDIQADRRLFYVAITRPTKKLLLLLPKDKAYQKAYEQESSQPPDGSLEEPGSTSRFVYEMNIKGALRVAKEIHPDAAGHLPTTSSAKNFNQYLSSLNLFLRLKHDA
ncbi:UvrD-helicase domain-containing protein [Salinimonas chungwhensis]|uniref:UvrD-helicase domain-containing protein n=1 Tax=Salinimonas chungwhensis TaxID=265425 RepID=UPI0003A44C07|nr:ATP-dependent helicase [Salinimonas chungwhensis]